jgi:hypothetical protein
MSKICIGGSAVVVVAAVICSLSDAAEGFERADRRRDRY